ncbi:MAG: c-type cytochrome biogenesis protein CcsB [Desulfobacter sp.]|nr:c-type cytochrome biogenesis protein CcsB [Desulfobacter sp.]WDP86167.1 MAG: c-type cytochrome biogenesis protein CcsB [Desulfobacter sp.]
MNSSLLLSAATFIYALASVFYIGSFSFKKKVLAKLGVWVIVIGLVANTGGILLRWVESYQMGYGHAPFSNMYESLVFFSWTVAALYIFVEFKYRESIIGVFVSPLIFLAIAYASFDPSISSKISPLIPALKSNWLIAHVITCFLGYAGFALAFGFSFMYFIKPKDPDGVSIFARLPDWEIIDEMTYQMIVFGFLFLTIGIITGAVWANSAWGKYWSWDPKETWSLITWFVYAIFLHLRLMRGWQGRNLALVSIIGFVAVLFTYFGVNYLLSGLHSYG